VIVDKACHKPARKVDDIFAKSSGQFAWGFGGQAFMAGVIRPVSGFIIVLSLTAGKATGLLLEKIRRRPTTNALAPSHRRR
jgi:hypothetical protein